MLAQARLAHQVGDVAGRQPQQRDALAELGEVGAGVLGVGLVGAARGEQEQRPAAQPAADVGEGVDRGRVGGVQVVDEHDSRHRPRAAEREQPARGVEKPLAGARLAEAGERRRAELGQEPCSLAAAVVGDVVSAQLGGAGEQLGEHAVGEAALTRVRPGGDDAGAGAAARGEELLGEPGLAHSGLALDDRDPAVLGDPRVGRRQPLPRRLPAHQRPALGGRRHRRDGALRGAALVDGVVQLGGLGEWPHPELAVESADALAVLGERIGAPARARVQRDQPAVGRLVQRVEREPLLGPGDGLGQPARAGEQIDQPVEGRGELALDGVGRDPLPVVEGGAVAHRESRQQLTAVQVDRGRQRAGVDRGVGGRSPELGQIEPGAREVERHRAAIGHQPLAAERRAQGRERPPQGRPGALAVVLGPEQRRDHVAPLDVPVDGEVGEDRRRLAGVDRQWAAVEFHDRSAQK